MRNPLFRLIATFIAVAAFATPEAATAQSGPVGIGFAQAEEGTWWCRGDNAVTTLAARSAIAPLGAIRPGGAV
jgi:hypothetical protein